MLRFGKEMKVINQQTYHKVRESMDSLVDLVPVSFLLHIRMIQMDFLCYSGSCILDCDLLLRSELLFRMCQDMDQYI